jgi:hypothetical protein
MHLNYNAPVMWETSAVKLPGIARWFGLFNLVVADAARCVADHG